MIRGKILTSFAKFQRIVSVNDFRLPIWLQELLQAPLCLTKFWRVSQALVHFVIGRASFVTDHRMSGRPIRSKKKHYKTIGEHTCDNSPTDVISSSLKWWSSMHGVDTL